MRTMTRKLAQNALHLVEVQGVRLDKAGTKPAGDYLSLCGNGYENQKLRT
jgi:hypothetical protein